ncbi:hypothetical protein LshimejAT787_0500810 [Lyophyllum shimeji]|uniref:BTB domain-containing protein n=1 Tax=Lyophyllum shimeji TaxID=47721 RepID=A0A9P3UPE4_LYOSH|nr:hypothetical protein LshimejAT787_0500810 [Lyophyllum shimeji]
MPGPCKQAQTEDTLKTPSIQPLDNDTAVDDTSYYFQDVIFLVENIRFKVPRHHFDLDSVVFRDMFRLPSTENSPLDGSSKENPLRLEGVAKSDFVPFLKVICPKQFHRQETLTVAEWVSVLKLATMWEFEEARELSIRTITQMEMEPAWKIDVARAFNVKQWYWPALRALGESTEPLSNVTERLGIDFTLRVAQLRGMVAGHREAWGALKKLRTQPANAFFLNSPPQASPFSGSVAAPVAVQPAEKVPIDKFIEQLFHEEVKGVPLAVELVALEPKMT